MGVALHAVPLSPVFTPQLVWTDMQFMQGEMRRHSVETERLMSVCSDLQEENVTLLRRMSGGGTAETPAWFDSAQSYQDHSERVRLQSLVEEEGESDENDDDDNDVFAPSPVRAHPVPPAQPSPTRRVSGVPPLRRASGASGSTPCVISTTVTLLPPPSLRRPSTSCPSLGATPTRRLSGRLSVTDLPGVRRGSMADAAPEIPPELSERVESLVIFPKLAKQGSAPMLAGSPERRNSRMSRGSLSMM